MTSSEIRNIFLDFFKSKQHQIVSSAPMVLKNDPTLMFTNAGMNQFKDIFLDNKPAEYPRIADTQKCLRVSGKHNDLEEVGHDNYHHTMFEMLGNWSFGDYFKKDAITWAYELLTKIYGIPEDILYATYFEGDTTEQLDEDSEAKMLWETFLPAERVLPGNKKDNFWEMGDSGPCGPCSEIHVDLRTPEEKKQIPGNKLVNKNHPEVIEIWNLVFIQFNRDTKGNLHLLKNKHVDTGMGFERLCRVIQQKKSNYDTDIFTSLIRSLEINSKNKYGFNEQTDIAFRVIVDHIRAVSFSIADGQIPSNVKAGYVIRRILRRAVRYGYTFLNLKEPFLFKLVPVLIKEMGVFFHELSQQQQLIETVIREEEISFLRTLQHGIEKFEEYISQHPEKKIIEGKFVFELYDTFGFPFDLTALMAKEKCYDIELEKFNCFLNEQRERSRKDAVQQTEDWVIINNIDKTQFVGYDVEECSVFITKYRKVEKKGQVMYHLILDKTPFYAESGGQVGDSGVLISEKEQIKILDTKKELDMFIHIAERIPEQPELPFLARINTEFRQNTKLNHTATHLLHNALRKVLGTHVEQKGSLVSPEYLRFDFSHFHKTSEDEILSIERLVNSAIRQNFKLQEQRNIDFDEAVQKGAIALFGEKYDKTVRLIQFGNSIELCGGTHVSASGEIGFFKIISESAIAAGIRRIEAVTGEAAQELLLSQWTTIHQLKEKFNNPKNLLLAVDEMKEQLKNLEKKIKESEEIGIIQKAKEFINESELRQNVRFLSKQTAIQPEHVKILAFELKKLSKEDVVLVLGNVFQEKVSLTILVSENLVEKYKIHAGNLVKELSKEIGGGGGGQAHFATAGGTDSQKIDHVLQLALQRIDSLIK